MRCCLFGRTVGEERSETITSRKLSKFLLPLLWMAAGSAHAQASAELSAEIAKLDSELFAAFNTCDIEKMADIFAKDLEFYHDTGGLGDYARTMDATRTNCDRKLGLERKLVEGSLEVYPIEAYGAIQKGKHTFCHMENGVNDCGTFDFVHIWRRTEGAWKLARVISYGH